jgi:replicative DNA helicase
MHVALELDQPVLFVSLEQAGAELVERALCNLSGVDGQRLRLGVLNEDENKKINEAGERFRHAKMTLSDRSAQRLLTIAGTARRAKQRGELSLLVIDYLQLIEPENQSAKRYEQVGQISRGLKHLARDLAVPVLCLAQLNRASEERADQLPMLADLRESGNIEADADVVLLLSREKNDPSELRINVAKQRNGPCAAVIVRYDRARHRFSDAA